MITRIVLLNNTEFTIDRPIVKSAIDKIKNDLLKNKEMPVYFITDKEEANFETDYNIKDNKTYSTHMEVNVEKIQESDYMFNNTAVYPDSKAILMDNNIGYLVNNNIINTTFNLNIRLYSKNRNEIVRLISLLKSTAITDSNRLVMDVEYYYTIPVPVLALTINIAELLNKKPSEYLLEISRVPIDYIKSRTDDYKVPIVREIQPNVFIYLMSEPYDLKPEKDEKGYYIELQFSFDIEIPSSLFLRYPITVNNKPIDKKFLPDEITRIHVDANNYFTEAMEKIKNNVDMYVRESDVIIKVPNYDSFDFNRIAKKPGMVRLVSILLEILPEDPNLILTLEELKALGINEFVLDYLKTRIGDSLFKPGFDIFHFELFENQNLRDLGLYLNTDGEIRSSKELDLNKTYRIVLNVVVDLNIIFSPDGLNYNLAQQYIEMLKKLNLQYHYETDNIMYTVMLMKIITMTLNDFNKNKE